MTRRVYPQYDSQEYLMNKNRVLTLLKSKTVWGAVAGATAFLLGQSHVGLLEAAQAAGPVLAALGIRDALIPGRQ